MSVSQYSHLILVLAQLIIVLRIVKDAEPGWKLIYIDEKRALVFFFRKINVCIWNALIQRHQRAFSIQLYVTHTINVRNKRAFIDKSAFWIPLFFEHSENNIYIKKKLYLILINIRLNNASWIFTKHIFISYKNH